MQPKLSAVTSELPDPQYPADIKANGWKPEFDVSLIESSETWTLAEDDERPWLLRIWFEAWKSVPVGSMPSDRHLFARRIGCKPAFLAAHAEILLRGWVLHSDDNLYHQHVTGLVLMMLERRLKTRKRVKEFRNKLKCNALPTRDQRVSNAQEQEQEQEQEEKEIIKEKRSKRFVPPTVAEVAAYCAERNNQVDPQRFIDHYEAGGWMRNKTKIKSWKAAVRTWENNNATHSNNTARPESAHDRRKRINQEIRDRAMSHFQEVG